MTLAGLEREAGRYDQAVHNAERALHIIDERLVCKHTVVGRKPSPGSATASFGEVTPHTLW